MKTLNPQFGGNILQLAAWVMNDPTPITEKNWRRYLPNLAFEKDPVNASCPNGSDHGCSRGIGRFIGITPYGYQDYDPNKPGEPPVSREWDQQLDRLSAERLNRFVHPVLKQIILSAPERLQKIILAEMILQVNDGNIDYNILITKYGQSDAFQAVA